MRLLAYKDAKFGWRWKIVARNGKIVCASSEAFATLAKCRRNALMTESCIWEHITPLCKVEFTNEADLHSGKKSKPLPTLGCGTVEEGDIMHFSDGTMVAVTMKPTKKTKGKK